MEWEKSDCTVEKPGGYHLNQVTKGNITSRYHVTLIWCNEKGASLLPDSFPAKPHNSSLIARKMSDTSKLRDFPQKYLPQNYHGCQKQGMSEKLSQRRLKGNDN